MCTIDKARAARGAPQSRSAPASPPSDHCAAAAAPLRTRRQMIIKGVRSFSPDNQNAIEFYKPLTLIVGSNGAGKTVRVGWGPARAARAGRRPLGRRRRCARCAGCAARRHMKRARAGDLGGRGAATARSSPF